MSIVYTGTAHVHCLYRYSTFHCLYRYTTTGMSIGYIGPLFVNLPQIRDSNVTFSVFESSCHLSNHSKRHPVKFKVPYPVTQEHNK